MADPNYRPDLLGLQPFNKHSRCSRCGCRRVKTDWVAEASWERDCEADGCPVASPAEHLHRQCKRCGYWWPEACLEVSDA